MHVYVRVEDLLIAQDVPSNIEAALITLGDDTLVVLARPSAMAFLTALRSWPVRVVAVTSGQQALTARMLQAVGLLDLLDGVVGERTVTPRTSGPWVLVVPSMPEGAAEVMARRLGLDADLANDDHVMVVPSWVGGHEPESLEPRAAELITQLGRLGGESVERRAPPSPRRPIPTWFFVLVVVRRGHRFLVVEEASSQGWYLPAGRVHPGETLEDAAIRETLEETGIPIILEGVIRVEYTPSAESSRCRVVYIAHPADDTVPRETPTEHSLRAQWVTVEEASRRRLRSSEVLHIFRAVEDGAPIFPPRLLVPAGSPW